MTFKVVNAPSFGRILVMRPTKLSEATRLRGVNYFVDEDGSLQAYEYTESDVMDTSKYPAFVAEFCALVVERGLQHKLGLKLKNEWDLTHWTEYEFPCYRSTIIIPQGMPAPEGSGSASVTTEWDGKATQIGTGDPKEFKCIGHTRTCSRHCSSHCRYHCVHCEYHCEAHCEQHCDYSHYNHSKGSNDCEWYFGGQKIEPGTPVHSLVTAVIEVW